MCMFTFRHIYTRLVKSSSSPRVKRRVYVFVCKYIFVCAYVFVCMYVYIHTLIHTLVRCGNWIKVKIQ